MGFFGSLVRRVGKIAKGAVKGVQDATGAVSGVLGKLDAIKNSPVGKLVMMGLMANPKTRGLAMKLDEGISQGAELSSLASRLSHGEQSALKEAMDRASQGRIMGT